MATYQILFENNGNLSVADDVSPWYICSAPYGLKLLGVDLAVKTPPQIASIMIDIEWSNNGLTWASIFGVPFLYGIHDGTDNNSTLRDLSASFTTDLVGLIIDNVSDGSTGIIQTVFPPSYIYAPLLGGDENDWDNGDGYTIFGAPFLYGTHTGPNNAVTLTDSSANFTDSLIGLIIDNTSDGSSGIISAVNSSTNLSVTLAGGTDNDWDTTDGYTIAVAGGIRPGEHIGVGGIPSVTELAYGGLLRLDIEQCGVSPNPGADLTVSLRVRQ